MLKRARSPSPSCSSRHRLTKPEPRNTPHTFSFEAVSRQEYILEPTWHYLAVNVFKDADVAFPIVQSHQIRVHEAPGPSIHRFLGLSTTQYGKYTYKEVYAVWKNIEYFVKHMSDAEIMIKSEDPEFLSLVAKIDFDPHVGSWGDYEGEAMIIDNLKEVGNWDEFVDEFRRKVFGLNETDHIIDWQAPFWKWYGEKYASVAFLTQRTAWDTVDIPFKFIPYFLHSDYENPANDLARDPFGDTPLWKSVSHHSRWMGSPGKEMHYFDSGCKIPLQLKVMRLKFYLDPMNLLFSDAPYMQMAKIGPKAEEDRRTRNRVKAENEDGTQGPGSIQAALQDLNLRDDQTVFEIIELQDGTIGPCVRSTLPDTTPHFWQILGPQHWLGAKDDAPKILSTADLCPSSLWHEDAYDLESCSIAHLCLEDHSHTIDELVAKMEATEISPGTLGELLSIFETNMNIHHDTQDERHTSKRVKRGEEIETEEFVAPDLVYGNRIPKGSPIPETRVNKMIERYMILKCQGLA